MKQECQPLNCEKEICWKFWYWWYTSYKKIGETCTSLHLDASKTSSMELRFLNKLMLIQSNSPTLMEPEGTLTYLQKATTDPHPEPIESSPLLLTLFF